MEDVEGFYVAVEAIEEHGVETTPRQSVAEVWSSRRIVSGKF